MSETRDWPEVRKLFDRLVDLPEPQRADELARYPSKAIRDEVARLLASDEALASSDRFVAGGLASTATRRPDQLARGGTFAGCTIVRQLGQGGMGEVYLAEQQQPQRLVAIKIIRADRLGPEAIRRFRREYHLLARVTHPAITQVHEVGVTSERGAEEPYILMEYVDGRPITSADVLLDKTEAERADLLARVCHGVHFAHQNQIVHRDLKPSNILVTADGSPRILDFGIARSLQQDDDSSAATMTGQIVGTLPYMSPEQLTLSPRDQDTRLDVYALGIIGYELFAGRHPYESLSSLPLADAMTRIQSGTAQRQAEQDIATTDLRCILQKAIAPQRSDRYASADGLASDLRRFASGQAVSARPLTLGYQLRVLWRTRRPLILGAALLATTLIAATTISIAFALRAEQARSLAVDARETTQDAMRFLEDTLAMADPAVAYGTEPTIREAVARVLHRSAELDEPTTRARALLAAARIYLAMGIEGTSREPRPLYQEALQAAQQARDLLVAAPDASAALRGESLVVLGRIQRVLEQHQDALRNLNEGLDLLQIDPSVDQGTRQHAALHVATARLSLGDLADCETIAREVLTAPATAGHAAEAALLLGDVEVRRGDRLAARGHFARAVDLTADDPHLRAKHAIALDKQANTEDWDLERRLATQQHVLALRQRVFPAGHPFLARSLLVIASIHRDMGDFAEMLTNARAATAIYTNAYADPEHRDALRSRIWEGLAEVRLERFADATTTLTEVIEAYERKPTPSVFVIRAYLARASAELSQRNCAAARGDLASAQSALQRFPEHSGRFTDEINDLSTRLATRCD